MDINLLIQFKKVAETEHLTSAAKSLLIAQPALSRNISRLENQLGVKLFDRKGKSIKLNAFGKILLRHANQIIDEINVAKKEIQLAQQTQKNTLAISMFAASKLLPDIILKFNRQHPNISLKIIQENLGTATLDFDVRIFSSALPNQYEFGATLLKEDIVIALPKNHPLNEKEQLDVKDLSKIDFICMPKGKGLRKITDDFCQLAGIEPNIIFECETPDLTRELIATGIGAAFIPEITWAGIRTDHIVLHHLKDYSCQRYINVTYPNPENTTEATELFIAFIKRYFAQLSLLQSPLY